MFDHHLIAVLLGGVCGVAFGFVVAQMLRDAVRRKP